MSGGGVSTNAATRLEGSAGQPVASASSATGFTLESGFWPNAVPCPFAVSPRGQYFTLAGGLGSLNVIAPGFCSWNTTITADWITLSSADSGTGNFVLTYEVRENFTGSARQALITASGLTQVVVQDAGLGDDCGYSINPQFQTFSAGGGGVIDVAAEERCAWQAVATVSWITITSTNVGIGNGTVTYAVSNNASATGRSGKVIIADKIFSVKQKGS